MIYLHNLRTVYQSTPILSNSVSIRKEQQIDFHIDINIAEYLFNKYKIYNTLGYDNTIMDIKLKNTIINIYKHRDDILFKWFI